MKARIELTALQLRATQVALEHFALELDDWDLASVFDLSDVEGIDPALEAQLRRELGLAQTEVGRALAALNENDR
jgi:hypothetical protein